VLRADAGQLPQWLGVDLGQEGYAVARLTGIKAPAADTPEMTQLLPRYAQAWGAAEAQAYYDSLKVRFKAAIEPDAIAAAAPTAAK
jgi:peptidyl-prolyl cis-trans isomerase D